MKFATITAVTLFCTAQINASPARTTNQKLESTLAELNKNCKYPTALNNAKDYDKFFECVYNKYAAEKVTTKQTELQTVMNRVKIAYNRNKHDPELQKRRIKAILVNNAEKFGMTKREVVQNMGKYQTQINNLLANMDIEGMKKNGEITVNQLVDMGNNVADSYIDQGKQLMEENPEITNVLTSFWNSWSNSNQGKELINKADDYITQGKNLAEQNGDKSLAEIANQVVNSEEVQEAQGKIEELLS